MQWLCHLYCSLGEIGYNGHALPPEIGSLVEEVAGVKTLRILAMMAVLAAFGLTACTSAQAPTEVTVTEVEFSIEASQTAFSVGKTYRFVVTNNGGLNHDFLLIPPEDDLPHISTIDELYSYGRAHIAEIPPGVTKTIEYTFKPSDRIKLEMASYYPPDYEEGMFVPITVT